jgi:hypothetical protein
MRFASDCAERLLVSNSSLNARSLGPVRLRGLVLAACGPVANVAYS